MINIQREPKFKLVAAPDYWRFRFGIHLELTEHKRNNRWLAKEEDECSSLHHTCDNVHMFTKYYMIALYLPPTIKQLFHSRYAGSNSIIAAPLIKMVSIKEALSFSETRCASFREIMATLIEIVCDQVS